MPVLRMPAVSHANLNVWRVAPQYKSGSRFLFMIFQATTGLHGSVGWKFAEYVAFAKAIVSEPLNCEVPGDFKPGQNYLTFRSPTELVEQASTLFSDNALRHALMTNNARYYLGYVRPDALVLNSLLAALSASSE